jgi:hypothetical protein
MSKKDKRVSKNPPGYLAKSIREDFKPPQEFKTKAQLEAERLEAERAEQELAAKRTHARALVVRLKSESAAVDAYLAGLDAAQRAQLEREAFAASELNAKLFGKIIVREHVGKLLGLSTDG